MIRKALTIMILLILMLSSVSAQLFAKWRMPDNRLRFILTLPEDQDGESYWNFCYSSIPRICYTRAVSAENITIANVLVTKSLQEEGRRLEPIVLDSVLNVKFNVDLQVPTGDDYKLLTILSQYTLTYFNAGVKEYTEMTPGYSLSVLDERANSFPITKKQGTSNYHIDGKTVTFQGRISWLATIIHYETGAFVWDKTGIKGEKHLSFTVDDKSSIDSWLKGVSELGLGAKPDSASVDYVEIFKLGK